MEFRELQKNLFMIGEGEDPSSFLVIGEEKACVIDTRWGKENLYALAREKTDKPILLINTHGHPDHIFGNVYFEKACLHPADLPIAEDCMRSPAMKALCAETGCAMPPFEAISGGDVFDLGGKTLEVIEFAGHTPGEILLLLREDRILFTGDAINHNIWMQLDCCPSIEQTAARLEELLYLEKEADRILHGHANDFDDISLIRAVLQGMREIIAGENEKDTIYEWFGGTSMRHRFQKLPGRHFQEEDSGICYQPFKIRG